MKNLVIIVHTNTQRDVADLLRGLKQVPGFTIGQVEGHGVQVENDPFLSTRDKVVGYVPRVRVDILLEDTDVDAVLEALRTNLSNIGGSVVYWIANVEGGRLLRTDP